MSDSSQPTPEAPSRYDRSFGGLLAAMVVTVLFVAAYVGFRAVTRDQPDGRPHPEDYLQSVSDLQETKVTVAYPRDLPTGWAATTVDYDRGTHPAWGLGIVTAEGDFVGVEQQAGPLEDLLHTYVDQEPSHGADATVESELGNTWQTWSDSGGDHAFSMQLTTGALAGDNLLVYGSAPVKEQEELIQLLTIDTLHGGPDAH